MEVLFSCFSSSTTTNTESWPRHISQPVAYRGEAEEAAGIHPPAECHSFYKADRQTKTILKKQMRGVRPIERALEERSTPENDAIRGIVWPFEHL